MEPSADHHCPACGRATADVGAHAACARLVALDPPRFCTTCGFRLDVQVYPDRFTTWCRRCRPRERG